VSNSGGLRRAALDREVAVGAYESVALPLSSLLIRRAIDGEGFGRFLRALAHRGIVIDH
jgi:hypothetical protein